MKDELKFQIGDLHHSPVFASAITTPSPAPCSLLPAPATTLEHGLQEFVGFLRGGRGLVAVAAEFHVYAAGKTDLREAAEDGGEIDLAFAEHQVLVDAGPHVLDVHVDQSRGPAADHFVDRTLALAMQMADVQGQAEVVHARLGQQFFPAGHGIDEHARLGLESDGDLLPRGIFADLPQAVDEPGDRLRAIDARGEPSRPERNAVAAQLGGGVDGVLVEVDPPFVFRPGRG